MADRSYPLVTVQNLCTVGSPFRVSAGQPTIGAAMALPALGKADISTLKRARCMVMQPFMQSHSGVVGETATTGGAR